MLFTAGLIVLLHSIVPHHHHGELSEQKNTVLHSANECLCDWLQMVFHDDLGEGHLEHFVLGEELEVLDHIQLKTGNADFDGILGSISLPPSLTTKVITTAKEEILITSLYHTDPTSLRGPPTLA